MAKLFWRDQSKPEGVIKYHDSDEDYSTYQGAGLFLRLCSSLLDGIFLGTSQKAIYALITFLADVKQIKDFFLGGPYYWDILSFSFLLIPSYFIVLKPLKNNGQTLAKKILGLKIIRDDFSVDLSWGQIILREFFCKVISVGLFPISLISILFRKDKRTLHDFMCSTRVIKL